MNPPGPEPEQNSLPTSSSREVLRPFSEPSSANRIVRFHANAVPSRPFAGPQGFSPRSTPQLCFMLLSLMGFVHLQSVAPDDKLCLARRQVIPSQRWLTFTRKARPFSGVFVCHQAVPMEGILHPSAGPLLSWALFAFMAFLSPEHRRFQDVAVFRRLSFDGCSAHGLGSGLVQARSRSGPSASLLG